MCRVRLPGSSPVHAEGFATLVMERERMSGRLEQLSESGGLKQLGGDGDLERGVPLNTAPLNSWPRPLLCVHVLAYFEFGLDLCGDQCGMELDRGSRRRD